MKRIITFDQTNPDDDDFSLLELSKLKDEIENFNNRKVVDAIKFRFFDIEIQIKEIEAKMQNMDNIIHDKYKINKNYRLKSISSRNI